MKNVIANIIKGIEIDQIISYVLRNVYKNGPVSITDMEIASYLTLYQPERLKPFKNSLLNYMGVFYKDVPRNTLPDAVFGQYKMYVRSTYNQWYTPVQVNIVKGIEKNKCFSFSAPTSTGKSYVFMNKIREAKRDVVIVVPSRALINEYFLKLSNLIQDKSVNILTFIDRINTKLAKRSVFIVTPERCRELFRQKDLLAVELFLFDEAQLSDEDSKRGLYFDSIVRRAAKAYPEAKYIFAHPFVKNPEAQIEKNHFTLNSSGAIQYKQKNVGQMYLCIDESGNFYHFGIDKDILGGKRFPCSIDPIEQTIKRGGSVLIYLSKSKIYNGAYLNQFNKYIDLCSDYSSPEIDYYIEEVKEYTGGDTLANKNHFSQMISLLKRGIVIHHGSLPLETRVLIEEYTKKGYCRICFATSTLEQGVNMPFDVVFLDRLEASKPLAVKNVIGRGGRSLPTSDFDFGYVILNSPSKISTFRRIMASEEILDPVSALEKNIPHDEDYEEFKQAILNNTYSDEFNLTENDLVKLTEPGTDAIIISILNSVFIGNSFISLSIINGDEINRLALYYSFQQLYARYLGRGLSDGERNVLDTAVKIMLWRVYGRTFKNICWYRYSYASKSNERDSLEKSGRRTNDVLAAFFTGYHDIPDKNLKVFSLFPLGTRAVDVDYDLIMYDTYDYLDKLIGFRLSDVFYAAFFKFYEKSKDERANKLAKYIKFGTDNERHIWMLRYGLSFEEIDIFDDHIENIDATGIQFKNSILSLSEKVRAPVARFIAQ